jgi:hypothetical protein
MPSALPRDDVEGEDKDSGGGRGRLSGDPAFDIRDGGPNFSARGDTPPDTCAANSIMRMTGVDTPQCAPAASVLNPYSYLFLPLFLLVVSGCPLLADTGPNANRSSPPRLLFIEGAYTASDP